MVAGLVAILWVSAFQSSVAGADNFGSSTSQNWDTCSNWWRPCADVTLTFESNVLWSPQDLTPNVLAAFQWAASNNYNPTDMTWTQVGTGPLVDVYMYDNDWGNNDAIGWHRCPLYAQSVGSDPARRCRGQEVHMSMWYATNGERPWLYPDGSVNWGRLVRTTTHEVGHSVGLKHSADTSSPMCAFDMSDPFICNWSAVWLTTHDVSHVNGNY